MFMHNELRGSSNDISRRLKTRTLCFAAMAASGALGITGRGGTSVALFFVTAGLLGMFDWAYMRRTRRVSACDVRLNTAKRLLDEMRYDEAGHQAKMVIAEARDFETRNDALTTLAWSELGAGRPRQAQASLRQVFPLHAVDAYTRAAVEAARGSHDTAIATLEQAMKMTALGPAAARLLIDLHAQRGHLDRVFALTLEHLDHLGVGDAQRVATVLAQADNPHAPELARAIEHLAAGGLRC